MVILWLGPKWLLPRLPQEALKEVLNSVASRRHWHHSYSVQIFTLCELEKMGKKSLAKRNVKGMQIRFSQIQVRKPHYVMLWWKTWNDRRTVAPRIHLRQSQWGHWGDFHFGERIHMPDRLCAISWLDIPSLFSVVFPPAGCDRLTAPDYGAYGWSQWGAEAL